MIDILLTHSVAHRAGKPPFFFSRFNFEVMKEKGNTHYCFACGGKCGFTPDADGKPTNQVEREYDSMKHHDMATHASYVIDGADQFDNPWSWLEAKIGPDFPYIVSIPSIN